MSKYKRTEILIVLLAAFTLFLIASFVYLSFFYEEAKKGNGINYVLVDSKNEIYNDFYNLIESNRLYNIGRLEKNIIDFNNLANEEKLNFAFDYFMATKEDIYEYGVTTDRMQDYLDSIFLDKISWSKKDISCFCGIPIFIYDSVIKTYIYNADHLGHGAYGVTNYYNKVISVMKYNEYYKVTIVGLWELNYDSGPSSTNFAYDTYNNALNQTNPLFEIEAKDYDTDYKSDLKAELIDNFNNYKDKMATYTYTFKKVDDQYLLVSFEFEDR